MGHSCILVPVAQLEPVVRAQIAAHTPEYLFPHHDDVHAHITLLGPFADITKLDDHLLGELEQFFSAVPAFTYRLTRVGAWQGRLAYAAPEDAEPFRRITLDLCDRYPDYPPYAGEYDGLAPHVTLGALRDDQPLALFTDALAASMPLEAAATEAQLHWYEPSGSRVLARFPLRTGTG